MKKVENHCSTGLLGEQWGGERQGAVLPAAAVPAACTVYGSKPQSVHPSAAEKLDSPM